MAFIKCFKIQWFASSLIYICNVYVIYMVNLKMKRRIRIYTSSQSIPENTGLTFPRTLEFIFRDVSFVYGISNRYSCVCDFEHFFKIVNICNDIKKQTHVPFRLFKSTMESEAELWISMEWRKLMARPWGLAAGVHSVVASFGGYLYLGKKMKMIKITISTAN